MNGVPALPSADVERFLTFEVAQAVYALPIAEIHEVAESERICCVPTLTRDSVGVMNWHGDALPLVSTTLLLDESEAAGEAAGPSEGAPGRSVFDAGPVLVISGRDDEPARLGIPIERVIGLVDGPRRRRGRSQLVVERRPVDGRVVNVLDPQRLVARAREIIGRRLGDDGAGQDGAGQDRAT